MRSSQSILRECTFGSRIAEDEVDRLKLYFVETEQWRRVLSGEADIVFGPKGSGKSALYSLLVTKKEELRLGHRTIFLAAENPRGTPAFRDLTTQPPFSEEQFRGLWKLYFLSILSNYVRHHLKKSRTENTKCQEVIQFLSTTGLLAPDATLPSRLKADVDYIL